MGIWGSGNFDCDGALNKLDDVFTFIAQSIRKTFEYESEMSLYEDFGESGIVANVDIIITLAEHYKAYPGIEPDEVMKWKQNYLDTFDRTIHQYHPEPEYLEQRRKVIVETFNRLHKLVEEMSSD